MKMLTAQIKPQWKVEFEYGRKAPLKALYLYKTFRQICPKIGDDVIKTSKYIFYFKAVHSTDREPMSAVRGEQIKIYIVDTWQDTLASKTKI